MLVVVVLFAVVVLVVVMLVVVMLVAVMLVVLLVELFVMIEEVCLDLSLGMKNSSVALTLVVDVIADVLLEFVDLLGKDLAKVMQNVVVVVLPL